MPQELNILALAKGQEHYVYVYDDNSKEPLLEVFQKQAEDANLSLNWFDCKVLTRKAHEQAREFIDLEKQTQRF